MERKADEITVTICKAVAESLETPIEELPPLSNVIDPDALGAVLASKSKAGPPDVTVSFEYAGLEVVVYSGHVVYILPTGCA